MTDDELKIVSGINKDELAEFIFERTVIDLALDAREILNKIVARQYSKVDGEKLMGLAKTIENYTKLASGDIDAKLPTFVGEAFVRFTSKFQQSQTEPMVKL